MNSIALKNDFKTLEIESTEKIKRKKLKDFILTSLYINEQDSYDNKAIYVNYLFLSNKYQIFIAHPNTKYFIFELFFNLCNKSKCSLVINESFFCIYVNGKFYYYKDLDYKLSDEKLIEFAFSNLSINIDEVIHLSDDKLDELLISFKENKFESTLVDINKTKEYGLIFFILYLSLLTLISIAYLNYTEMQNKKIAQLQKEKYLQNLEKTKTEMNFISFHDKFIAFYKNINKYNLKLENFKYTNSKFEFLISSNNKTKIFEFLDIYKNKITSSSIHFDNKRYVFHGSFKSIK
ncbi:hypothetical protein [Arcobacter roscoffensis]|uniref:Transmembrane protein n=1 Tax=Arcobacter roscoffensis TaxID=2961520 RepID=A0ABY5E3Y8_9BACT|nr:hypothetical protein [Arcobacter roscoffensis]UTJ05875.1 hypothetical protein NJU99_11530 [Arcobacter roscoffensis]